MTHQEIANFIWSVADEVLRDHFKRSKYADVILPFTVLRRLDCVLEDTNDKVYAEYQKLKDNVTGHGLENKLKQVAEHSFYNISKYNFSKLIDDSKNIYDNLNNYINGFSENMKDVLEKFKLRTNIDLLHKKNLLFLFVQKFASSNVDLHIDKVDNHQMGYIFEELIRRFNESSNENPGEHFTPREVIRLMANIVISPEKEELKKESIIKTVFDPACGTGGMLSITKEHILNNINPKADIKLFGQEINDETYAICKSDMMIKGDDADAERIKFGSSISDDGHSNTTFDYMLTNPPFGKDWKNEKDAMELNSRFDEKRLPRTSDGQLLFLIHILSKMADEGSRLAIVLNGSPLFTGDAGSGESNIRRWVIENDWVEAIIALPNQLFYNTGINTYIWIPTNNKEAKRKGKIMLINAVGEYIKMRKSLGDKRNEISPTQINNITKLYENFEDVGDKVKIFDNSYFGYRKITIERPLKLNFQLNKDRIERLKDDNAFKKLAISKKKTPEVKEADELEGRKQQDAILKALLDANDNTLYKNRDKFKTRLDELLSTVSIDTKTKNSIVKAILKALSEKDETADICVNSKKQPEADTTLRDYENVPLTQDVYDYFDKEVKPHVPDAWVSEDKKHTDDIDEKIGKVGYEINFNRYFYKYQPPRDIAIINKEIDTLQNEIVDILKQIG